MGSIAIGNLRGMLRSSGLIKDIHQASIEEQVVKFLYILAHNVKNRVMSFFSSFRRNCE